ncbi:MAG: hypothetical protein FJW38_18635 [Acidobacteria bacterium]|nr:hypothetical protein [Acidobacteriota bacterium]
MPVLYWALIAAVAIVVFFRKARFHYERIPKLPYEPGLDDPPDGEWIVEAPSNVTLARVLLPSAVEYAETEKLDRLALLLNNEPVGFLDKIVAPYAAALAFAGLRSGDPPYTDVVVKRARGGTRSRVLRAEHMGTISGRPPFLLAYMKAGVMSTVVIGFAGLLFAMWLPLLVLMIYTGLYRHAALFGLLPIVVLFPWYRSAVGLFAPFAIYLVVKSPSENGVS